MKLADAKTIVHSSTGQSAPMKPKRRSLPAATQTRKLPHHTTANEPGVDGRGPVHPREHSPRGPAVEMPDARKGLTTAKSKPLLDMQARSK